MLSSPEPSSGGEMEKEVIVVGEGSGRVVSRADGSESNASKPNELYRPCSLGRALTESLREMVEEGQMTPAQAFRVAKQYDLSMALGMKTLVRQCKVRPAFDPTATNSNWKRQAKKRMLAKEAKHNSAPLVSSVDCTNIQGTIVANNSVNGQWRLEARDVLVKHPCRSMRLPSLHVWLVEDEPEPPALARAKPLPS